MLMSSPVTHIRPRVSATFRGEQREMSFHSLLCQPLRAMPSLSRVLSVCKFELQVRKCVFLTCTSGQDPK